MNSHRMVQDVRVPVFLYGTAWKEERTAPLTRLALQAGFRGVDTANQRRHYVEASVGEAVAAAAQAGELSRADLFLQTKFTSLGGQDHRLPYDASADPKAQVEQSCASSLEHLQTTYIDSYVLHGPSSSRGITGEDWAVWQAMESLQRAGRVRLLGVSNVTLEQLEAFYEKSQVKPAFVQKRCFAANGWDHDMRAWCAERGVVYQAFSLLTANAREMRGAALGRAAARVGRTPAQVVFRFALQAGMMPLTGTSSAVHMQEDLAALDFELLDAEMDAIERIAL